MIGCWSTLLVLLCGAFAAVAIIAVAFVAVAFAAIRSDPS